MFTAWVSPSPADVAAARAEIAKNLRQEGVSDDLVEDAELAVNELLTNAIHHARPLPSGDIAVRWEVREECIRLGVSDGGSSTLPRLNNAGPTATRGRGLYIIDAICTNWTVVRETSGKTVWAELAINPARSSLVTR